MDANIIGGSVGPKAKYSVDFKGGQLVAELLVDESLFDGGIVIKLDAGAVMDAVAKAIPGVVDDAIISLIKAALLK